MKIVVRLTSPITEITSSNGAQRTTTGLRFIFNSWYLHKENAYKDKYSIITLTNDNKHLLVSPILNFYRRCKQNNDNDVTKLDIGFINFPISRDVDNLRISRCDKLLAAGRISFQEYRSKYKYKYPKIYKGQLQNV